MMLCRFTRLLVFFSSLISGLNSAVEECANPVQPNSYPPGTSVLLEKAKSTFLDVFGEEPTLAAHAPGRVNLIGEHTDYTGGFVLPLALDKRTVVVGSGKVVPVDEENSMCSIVSTGADDENNLVRFDANPDTLAPGDPFWSNYVTGVVKQYSSDLAPGMKFSFRAAYASDVPLGAGLSSSAALEVSTATLLESISGVVPTPQEKALRCQAAEHEFCGMPCGIMDQFISAMGVTGNLLEIDCRSNTGTPVPMESQDYAILVTNSKVKHALSDSEYPIRVKQCLEATEALAAKFTTVKSLRDSTLPMLLEIADGLDPIVVKRAQHVISENARVVSTVEALRENNLARVGQLMVESHESLRDDFEVSAPELDLLVDLAISFGDAVLGSRMTGGGFGGCTVTLVGTGAVEAVTAYLKAEYEKATGVIPDIFATKPGSGAAPLVLT